MNPTPSQQPNAQSALPFGKTQYVPPFPPQPTSGGSQGIPSLAIQSNIPGQKPTTYNLTKPVINIGRDPSNDIVIDTPVVSHFHAQIVREGNRLILVHPHPSRQQTTNGFLYQGRHILGNEPFRKPLVRGDIFRIGNEQGELVTLIYNDGSGALENIVPKNRATPLDAPIINGPSQPRSPQAQTENRQQEGDQSTQKSPKNKGDWIPWAFLGTVVTAIATIIAAMVAHGTIFPVGPTPSPSVVIVSPTSAITPSPSVETFSSDAEVINQLCTDFRQGDYGLAYTQLFSDSYHQQVTESGFVSTLNGYTCDIQGQFAESGSVEYIIVSFLKSGTNYGLCERYGLVNFTEGGWRIDQVTDLPSSSCQF
jgi:FHA domain